MSSGNGRKNNGKMPVANGRANGKSVVSNATMNGRANGKSVVTNSPVIQENGSSSKRDAPLILDVQPSTMKQENGSSSKRESTRDASLILHTKPENLASKKGSSGKQTTIYTNYFRLKPGKDFEFCQYRVDFTPEVEMVRVRRDLLTQLRPTFGGYIYDGGSIVYLTKKLPNDNNSFSLKTTDGAIYKVQVNWTKVQISLTDSMALNILNVLLRRAMGGLKLQLVQRNLYDPNNKINLPELHLELWPGYVTSIRQHEQDILLCCEISHKLMRQETLYDILRRYSQNSRGENFKDAFSREILGSVVLTDYNNCTYRIDDIDWNSSPSSTFDANGTKKSYLQYYLEKYNIKIRDPNQPLLISKPKARDIRGGRANLLCLIPELCRATGLTESMRSNYKTMSALAQYTRMDPDKRIRSLHEFSRRLLNTKESSDHLKSFNVQLEPSLVALPARKLNQEKIYFGEGKTYPSDDKADWTPALRNNKMFHNEKLANWGVVYPQRAEKDVQDFLVSLEKVSRPLGFVIEQPRKIVLPNDRNDTYAKEIENYATKDPSFILIILPNNNIDRYRTLKNITCVKRKIPTQVVVQRTVQKQSLSIVTKIAIQMNCKLGGAPWTIAMPLSGTMVCGFDVSRDTLDKTKSFGALIASMDLSKVVKFFSTVAPHRSGEECSNNIQIQMKKALMAYRDEHGAFPARILFYRDGVGDGEIQYVHEVEVKRLNNLFKTVYEGQQPKFAFVIVSKRINTRFFEKNGQRNQNPSPGTVIDDVVTLPERYDFYLISQSVRQGTVSPTSYNIIYDTLGLGPDRMQMLTYKMCHLYFNWCGTVQVPAVVQYAHKLSILVSQFIHNIPSDALGKKLHFL